MLAYVVRAATQSAARARRTEEIVYFAVQCGDDLMHRELVCFRIVFVRILVRTETVGNLFQKGFDAVETRMEKLSRHYVRLYDEVYFRSVRL